MIFFFKKIFSFLAYYTNFWKFASWIYYQKYKNPVIAVFTFHRILENEADKSFLQGYERGIHKSLYLRQLDLIRKLFRIISQEEFIEIVTGEKKMILNTPLALLTYDDADSEHGKNAFEPLVKRNIGGISFVPTAFIETEKRFYHLRLTSICNNLTNKNWEAITKDELPENVKDVILDHGPDYSADCYEIRREFIPVFENMKPRLRDRILDDWESKTNGYNLGIHCMSWEEIKEYSEKGIEAGSHTVNHNKLNLLALEEVDFELKESKRILENKLNKKIESISYPEGSYDERSIAKVRESGYKIGFTTRKGLITLPVSEKELYEIPRLNLCEGSKAWITYSFGAIILKSIIGTKRN